MTHTAPPQQLFPRSGVSTAGNSAVLRPPAPAPDGELALKEGIDTPNRFEDPKAGRCQRVPDWLVLVNVDTGECVDPRCRATNKCDYCRVLGAVETVEMLLLNALLDPPTLMATLTARTFPRGEQLRRTLGKVVLACRRRFPEFEWFVPRERQTRGELHIHPLIKGVPPTAEAKRVLYDVMTGVWCSREDAIAYPFEERHRGPQGLKSVTEGEGVVRYLTKELAHSLKSAQALELGYRGHRTSQTRGYFKEGATAARAAARESLRQRRGAWVMAQRGLTAEEIAAALEREADARWVPHLLPQPTLQGRRLQRELEAGMVNPPSRESG